MEATWYFIFLSVIVALVKTAVVLNFLNKNCDQSNKFLQTFGGSLQDCIDECDRHSRCKTVMFRRRMGHCILKGHVDFSTLDDSVPSCMYLKKTDWTASDLRPCNKNTCGETEKCVTSERRPEEFNCLKTICSPPSNITNANLLSDKQRIGSVDRYRCQSGYIGFGAPIITCTVGAKWSTTNFSCIRTCQKPKTVYNGALLPIKTNLTEGTHVQFMCGEDFQGYGSMFTSTCKNGAWSPNRVQCCDNGTELWPWWHRCTFYTGLVNSRSEANAICSEKNYHRTYIHSNHVKPMIERYGGNDLLLLTTETKPYLAKQFDFMKCLNSNSVNNTMQYENFTYDEMVGFLRNHNLVGEECDEANKWAPGEPNGGANENCIFTGKEFNYLYADIPCQNFYHFSVGAVCYKDLPVI